MLFFCRRGVRTHLTKQQTLGSSRRATLSLVRPNRVSSASPWWANPQHTGPLNGPGTLAKAEGPLRPVVVFGLIPSIGLWLRNERD